MWGIDGSETKSIDRASESEDESINFERDTDRRFSVIPMDFDPSSRRATFSAAGGAGAASAGRPSQYQRPSIFGASGKSVSPAPDSQLSPHSSHTTSQSNSVDNGTDNTTNVGHTISVNSVTSTLSTNTLNTANTILNRSTLAAMTMTSRPSEDRSSITNPLLRPSDFDSTIV
jgi:hypothetical protein